MANQRLVDHFSARRVFQVVAAKFIAFHLNVLIVDAGAVEMGDGLTFQLMQTV
ncbi:Uncharacterised protein [Klebsiella pneumoniae]|nr:Uncharacterised protein [Klebsiella pneumoniae]